MLVCIDRAYEHIGENADYPFFDAEEPSLYTKNSIEFCNTFQQNLQVTESFVQLIKDLDLLDTRVANYVPNNPDGTAGEPQKVAEFFAVSDAKLAALPDSKILELRANGALQQIYVHLNSLFGWDRLIARALARAAAEQAQQPAAANA
ncbi:MAG: SapC family protein, partial [Caulobacteraceae bacterium]